MITYARLRPATGAEVWLCESAGLALTGGHITSNYTPDPAQFQRAVLEPLPWTLHKFDRIPHFQYSCNYSRLIFRGRAREHKPHWTSIYIMLACSGDRHVAVELTRPGNFDFRYVDAAGLVLLTWTACGMCAASAVTLADQRGARCGRGAPGRRVRADGADAGNGAAARVDAATARHTAGRIQHGPLHPGRGAPLAHCVNTRPARRHWARRSLGTPSAITCASIRCCWTAQSTLARRAMHPPPD